MLWLRWCMTSRVRGNEQLEGHQAQCSARAAVGFIQALLFGPGCCYRYARPCAVFHSILPPSWFRQPTVPMIDPLRDAHTTDTRVLVADCNILLSLPLLFCCLFSSSLARRRARVSTSKLSEAADRETSQPVHRPVPVSYSYRYFC